MKLSICITQYNNQIYLPSLLKSIDNNMLEENSGDELEIIIVDDGGTCADKTISIIDEFKENKTNKYISDIKYIRHSCNKGTLLARKSAILHCTGDYVVCIDGDDELLPNSLKTVIKELKEYNPDVYEGRCKETFILDSRVMNSGNKDHIKFITDLKEEAESHTDKYHVEQGFYQTKTNLLYFEFCARNIIVWSKFVKRNIYNKAFDILEEFVNASNVEDVYIVFGILLNSKTYFGSSNYFYKYNGNLDGMCFRWMKYTKMNDVFHINVKEALPKIDPNIFNMYKSVCKILVDMDLKNVDPTAFLNIRKHILTRFINSDRITYNVGKFLPYFNEYYYGKYGRTLWDMVLKYMNYNPEFEYLKPCCICDDFGYLDLKDNPINYYECINEK